MAATCHRHHHTFVEIQLLVLFVLLLLLGVVLPVGVVGVVVVVGDPLDLAARLLPLSALVQRWLRRLLDEVVGLRLGQDGGPLPLDEQLGRTQRRTRVGTPDLGRQGEPGRGISWHGPVRGRRWR